MRRDADEDDMVTRAIKGDVDAYGDLYLLHVNTIFRYVYFRIGEWKDAEDITEQVFIKAWEALPRYKQKGIGLANWLYRIAHNEVVDHHRKKTYTLLSYSETIENLEKSQNSILDLVLYKSDLEKMSRLIPLLTEDQQQIIVLRFLEGLSHDEISKITGKTPGACRMIQHRALQALHNLFTEKFSEDS